MTDTIRKNIGMYFEKTNETGCKYKSKCWFRNFDVKSLAWSQYVKSLFHPETFPGYRGHKGSGNHMTTGKHHMVKTVGVDSLT